MRGSIASDQRALIVHILRVLMRIASWIAHNLTFFVQALCCLVNMAEDPQRHLIHELSLVGCIAVVDDLCWWFVEEWLMMRYDNDLPSFNRCNGFLEILYRSHMHGRNIGWRESTNIAWLTVLFGSHIDMSVVVHCFSCFFLKVFGNSCPKSRTDERILFSPKANSQHVVVQEMQIGMLLGEFTEAFERFLNGVRGSWSRSRVIELVIASDNDDNPEVREVFFDEVLIGVEIFVIRGTTDVSCKYENIGNRLDESVLFPWAIELDVCVAGILDG